MALSDDATPAGFAVAVYDGTELAAEVSNLRAIRSLRDRVVRLMFVVVGAVLLTAVLAQAALREAAAAEPPQTVSPDLASQIAARVAPLLPEGVRLKAVSLQFTPPADSTLESVAPGVTKLQSRTFMVELRAPGHTLAFSAAVDAERQVITASHEIAAGEPVTDKDVETRWVEAFGAAPGALSELPAGVPYVAAGPLSAGRPLYLSSLTRALAVRPGDLVSVSVKNGTVTLRTQLEARSAGAIGESAMMVNLASGALVTVTVTGPKAAELVMQ